MSSVKNVKLIVSEAKAHVAGAQEIQISLVDEHLKPAKPIGARLCGGTSTCIAVVETD
jgi:hypothetical protein